jgi:Outer membrane protein beta-barrel domain
MIQSLRRSDMLSKTVIAAALVAITLVPVPARADVLLIPFFGVNFGGDSGKEFSEAFDTSQYNWGASLTFMGGGIFGVEGDFGFSPDFYGQTEQGGSSALTATGNLIVGIPFGGQQGFGVRPYGLVGAGLLKSASDFGDAFTDIDESNVTWSAGGGVLLFFGTRAGIRADVRYFRTFDDLEILGIEIGQSPGKVDFTRGSLGLVLRF